MNKNDDLESYSEETLNCVSKNVIRIRTEKGYSQLKLALEMGLNGAAYLGRMELRKQGYHFNIEHLAKASKIMNVDICEFFKKNNELLNSKK